MGGRRGLAGPCYLKDEPFQEWSPFWEGLGAHPKALHGWWVLHLGAVGPERAQEADPVCP